MKPMMKSPQYDSFSMMKYANLKHKLARQFQIEQTWRL